MFPCELCYDGRNLNTEQECYRCGRTEPQEANETHTPLELKRELNKFNIWYKNTVDMNRCVPFCADAAIMIMNLHKRQSDDLDEIMEWWEENMNVEFSVPKLLEIFQDSLLACERVILREDESNDDSD